MQKKRFGYDAAELSGKVGALGERVSRELIRLPQGDLHEIMLNLYLTIMDTQRELMDKAVNPDIPTYQVVIDAKTGTAERRKTCRKSERH